MVIKITLEHNVHVPSAWTDTFEDEAVCLSSIATVVCHSRSYRAQSKKEELSH